MVRGCLAFLYFLGITSAFSLITSDPAIKNTSYGVLQCFLTFRTSSIDGRRRSAKQEPAPHVSTSSNDPDYELQAEIGVFTVRFLNMSLASSPIMEFCSLLKMVTMFRLSSSCHSDWLPCGGISHFTAPKLSVRI